MQSASTWSRETADNLPAVKEETPDGNPGSVSETLKEETNMSIVSETTDKRELTDDDLVDGQLYKLGEESKWFKPIERRMRKPVSEMNPKAVEDIRHKPDNIPAIWCPFGDALDLDGNKIKLAPFPDGATFRANHLYRENGITYVGRGHYWSDGITMVDGVEYVDFKYSSGDLPCPVHEWCTGHYVSDIEQLEADGDDSDLYHCGETRTLFEFTSGEPGKDDDIQRLAGHRAFNDDKRETVNIFVELEVTCDRTSAQELAAELHAAADALAMYAAGMERA